MVSIFGVYIGANSTFPYSDWDNVTRCGIISGSSSSIFSHNGGHKPKLRMLNLEFTLNKMFRVYFTWQ